MLSKEKSGESTRKRRDPTRIYREGGEPRAVFHNVRRHLAFDNLATARTHRVRVLSLVSCIIETRREPPPSRRALRTIAAVPARSAPFSKPGRRGQPYPPPPPPPYLGICVYYAYNEYPPFYLSNTVSLKRSFKSRVTGPARARGLGTPRVANFRRSEMKFRSMKQPRHRPEKSNLRFALGGNFCATGRSSGREREREREREFATCKPNPVHRENKTLALTDQRDTATRGECSTTE